MRIHEEDYQRLLEAYRDNPDPSAYSAIGASAGVSRATAKRAWERGWPERGWPAIRELLDGERDLARARRLDRELEDRKVSVEEYARRIVEEASRSVEERMEEARAHAAEVIREAEDQAREKVILAEVRAKRKYNELLEKIGVDAVEQRADEAILCRGARKTVLHHMAFVQEVLTRAKYVAAVITKEAESGSLSFGQALKFMEVMGRVVREANQAGHLAMQLERLRVGSPTDVIGVRVEPATLEEAARDIEHAHYVLQLARDRGLVAEPREDQGNGRDEEASKQVH